MNIRFSARNKVISIALAGVIGFGIYLTINSLSLRATHQIVLSVSERELVALKQVVALESRLHQHRALIVEAVDLEDIDLLNDSSLIHQDINQNLVHVKTLAPGSSRLIDDLSLHVNNYHDSARTYAQLLFSQDSQDSQDLLLEIYSIEMGKSLKKSRDAYNELKSTIENQLDQAFIQLQIHGQRSEKLGYLIGLVVLVIITSIASMATYSLSRSLNLSLLLSSKISQGELKAQNYSRPRDEFGELIKALEIMRESIQDKQRRLMINALYLESLSGGDLNLGIKESNRVMREQFGFACTAVYSFNEGLLDCLDINSLNPSNINTAYFDTLGIAQNCIESNQSIHLTLEPDRTPKLNLLLVDVPILQIDAHPITHGPKAVGAVITANLSVLDNKDVRLVSECLQKLSPILNKIYEDKVKKQLQKDLESYTKELERANKENKRINEAKSEFLACMSHEIRTPMNGIIGMLNLITKGKLSNQQKVQINIAKESGDSLLTIINDILDFTKIEASKLELDKREFNLETQINLIVDSFAPQAQKKNIELMVEFPDPPGSFVKGDAVRIRQIYSNLIGNAIKFTQKGEIKIHTRLIKGNKDLYTLIAEISDTGIGIKEGDTAHLFGAFTQADASTTRKYGGTGLGLAIVEKLCAIMHGNIRAESSYGEGSNFHFEIQVEGSAIGIEKLDPDLNGRSVLVVDPNRKFCDSMSTILNVLNVHSVLTLDKLDDLNTNNFLDKNYKPGFDLVLVSIPNAEVKLLMSVHAFLSSLGAIKTPVIAMTNIDFRDNGALGRAGVSAHFSKPPTPHKLCEAIKSSYQCEYKLKGIKNFDPSSSTARKQNREPSKIPNILIVDDAEVNVAVVLGLLENFNLKTSEATNGQEAMDVLNKSKDIEIDLVLMDCQMPVLDGYETTKNIRNGHAGERYKNIPIIAMTANAMVGDKDKCLASGMNDYVSKPVDADHLFEVMQKYVELHEKLD